MKTDISNMNDNGDIKGLDAREDGVYITYFNGADTVTKKLGSGGDPITISGSFYTSGSAQSGGWGRSINISTSGTILSVSLPFYEEMKINSKTNCDITFVDKVLKVVASASGSNSQSNVPDGTVSTSCSGSYNVTLS